MYIFSDSYEKEIESDTENFTHKIIVQVSIVGMWGCHHIPVCVYRLSKEYALKHKMQGRNLYDTFRELRKGLTAQETFTKNNIINIDLKIKSRMLSRNSKCS